MCSPAVSMEHPVKAATPAVVVEVQPEREPRPAAIDKVMELVSVLTVLPPASSMVTVGWVPKARLRSHHPVGW